MGITALSAPEALLVALSGIVTVFIMLAVLCLMIPLLSKVVSPIEGKQAAPAAAAAAPAPAAAAPAPAKHTGETYTGEIALIGCDEKTAAMVMAIVSYETGIPLDQLIFHKIKAL